MKEEIDNVDELMEEDGRYYQEYAHCSGNGCSKQVRNKCWRYALGHILPKIGEYRMSCIEPINPGSKCDLRVDVNEASDDVIRTYKIFMDSTDYAKRILEYRIGKGSDAAQMLEKSILDTSLSKAILTAFIRKKAAANKMTTALLADGERNWTDRNNEMRKIVAATVNLFETENQTNYGREPNERDAGHKALRGNTGDSSVPEERTMV